MGFQVHATVALRKAPSEAIMTELDHKFGEATHPAGTRIVNLSEHVSMSGEADAIEFVRALVLDAVPPGSSITEISATPA